MSIYEYDEELHKKTLHDEGYEDGFHDGALSNLVSLICRKLQKGKSPQSIAEDLEEDLEIVEQICEAAKTCSPEYDVKDIMKILATSSKKRYTSKV